MNKCIFTCEYHYSDCVKMGDIEGCMVGWNVEDEGNKCEYPNCDNDAYFEINWFDKKVFKELFKELVRRKKDD